MRATEGLTARRKALRFRARFLLLLQSFFRGAGVGSAHVSPYRESAPIQRSTEGGVPKFLTSRRVAPGKPEWPIKKWQANAGGRGPCPG